MTEPLLYYSLPYPLPLKGEVAEASLKARPKSDLWTQLRILTTY